MGGVGWAGCGGVAEEWQRGRDAHPAQGRQVQSVHKVRLLDGLMGAVGGVGWGGVGQGGAGRAAVTLTHRRGKTPGRNEGGGGGGGGVLMGACMRVDWGGF